MQFKYLHYFESIYKHFLLSQFLQVLTKHGKKKLYEQALFLCFFLLKLKLRGNPFLIFFEIIEIIKPTMYIKIKKKKSQRKKKKKVKLITVVPLTLDKFHQYKKAAQFLQLGTIILSHPQSYKIKLFYELINIYLYDQSFIFRKKKEIYKQIILNKFNKHYR
jgi:ribosomal protein S7